ncbi:MAG: ATP-binding region, ATPase-like [uncultured Frankineae bacterium]|uniref:ATP-binding region, ATPase-like n=1 Tax=uncultured Frankineae bacterium TaxID=437475 RepID=A0A6J4KY68_9ACTN|nr:MAG: ATP-binding region, ATPase-like [uncultured Frankineae bacterium]
MERSPTGSRTAAAVRLSAVPLAVLALALSGLTVALHLSTEPAARSTALQTPEATVGPALAVVAALLLRRAAARRLPLLLLGVGLASSVYAAACAGAAHTRGEGVLGGLAAWLAAWTWAAAFPALAMLLPLLFPDGRLPSPRWRPVLRVSTAVVLATCAAAAVVPARVAGLDDVGNPLGVEALSAVRAPVQALLGLALPLLAALGLAALVARWRAADPVARRQVAWFGYGLAVAVVAAFSTTGWLLHLLSLALPAAVGVAVVRYRLYDIDALVDRTLAAAVLLAGSAVLYVAVVGWAGAALGSRGALPGFLGAVAVAVAFAPARRRVEQAVERMLHGRRANPYGLLTDLARALQGSRSPREALRSVAAEVADGLRLPAVRVTVDLPGAPPAVEMAGSPAAALVHTVPLRWQGETLGALAVAARSGAGELEPADRRLLDDLAGQLAAVAYALRLASDVELARHGLVTAVAEERRRLRRDLHDGLGPQLAAVALGLSTAERALGRADAARAGELVRSARSQLEAGVAEVRRLVSGLRPPALDELGLLEALRTTGPAAAGELDVRFEVDGELAALPAAVEVAAYRIVQEALTNVARHAAASRACVRLRSDGTALELTVADDGRGLPLPRTPGVGTASMRERAEELGGRCEVQTAASGGTVVRAVLPLPASVVA